MNVIGFGDAPFGRERRNGVLLVGAAGRIGCQRRHCACGRHCNRPKPGQGISAFMAVFATIRQTVPGLAFTGRFTNDTAWMRRMCVP